MDNLDNPVDSAGPERERRAPEAAWGPAPWLSALTVAALLAALVWRLLDTNPENRLVAAVLVVVAALTTLFLVRIRVRLRVGMDGIQVTGLLHTRHIQWNRIDMISTPQRGRFGRRATTLELEIRPTPHVDPDVPGSPEGGDPRWSGPGGADDTADDELLTFGSFDLGADPAAVGRELLRRKHAAGR